MSYYYKKQRIKILHLIGNKKGLRNQLVKLVVKNTSLLILLLECLVHLVQPYPGIKFQYKVDFIGIETMFNINMLFFFLGSLRIYTLIKVIGYCNIYSQDNSKNILYFFDKFTNNNMFFFKSNLKQNGLITLAFIGSISLFYFSLIFQILEYSEKNLDNPYYYYVNSLWFLIVTMCTGSVFLIFSRIWWFNTYEFLWSMSFDSWGDHGNFHFFNGFWCCRKYYSRIAKRI